MKRSKAFTLIELLIVLIIIAILAVVAFTKYQGFVETAKCTGNSEQHRKVVALAEDTYNFCRIDGSSYLNQTGKCNNNANYIRVLKKNSGRTQVRQEGNKCVMKWDCKTDWIGRPQNAGLSSGYFTEHARAEFNTPNNTSGWIRGDQWHNFEKPGYPARPGITNIRDKGVQMRIATYLGSDCKGGNFSNSGGDYLINDITWP